MLIYQYLPMYVYTYLRITTISMNWYRNIYIKDSFCKCKSFAHNRYNVGT